VTIIFFACKWILADISYNIARSEINSWYIGGIADSLADWNHASLWLDRAKFLNKAEPEYHLLEATLLEWRSNVAGNPITDGDYLLYAEQALTAYRNAIELRPGWPMSWIRLARQKAILQQFDAEFDRAFSRAIELGKWTPRVQIIIAEISALSWEKLDADKQANAIENAQRGLSVSSYNSDLLQFMTLSTMLPVICPSLIQEQLHVRARNACSRL